LRKEIHFSFEWYGNKFEGDVLKLRKNICKLKPISSCYFKGWALTPSGCIVIDLTSPILPSRITQISSFYFNAS
jgi:hypothetical protein